MRLVDQIASFAKPIFIITGGNPLMREDIFEVARHASVSGLRVVMSPSGTNVSPELVRRIRESGVQRISVSIDGSNAGIHDSFRQVPGAFDSVLASLVHARNGGLPFQINTTVTRHNIKDLPAMLDLAIALGAVTWDVFMLVPTGRGKVEMEITPEEYEGALAFIYDAARRAPMLVKMTCAPHFRRLERQRAQEERQQPVAAVAPNQGHGVHGGHMGGPQGRPPVTSRGCMAGNGFCFVSHVGEVFGCGYLPLLAGNVRQQHFRDIYEQSALFIELRDYHLLHGKCGACEYRAICGGCRARALGVNADYLGEEPYCTYQPAKGT
jgi:radical SAM protein with 4Fe4S-binding SPASM domain